MWSAVATILASIDGWRKGAADVDRRGGDVLGVDRDRVTRRRGWGRTPGLLGAGERQRPEVSAGQRPDAGRQPRGWRVADAEAMRNGVELPLRIAVAGRLRA